MATRYALYFTPPPGALADCAARWLGWDPADGVRIAHPELDGLPAPVSRITATPRKYGFHGTFKAPFRLAAGQTGEALVAGVRAFAAQTASVTIPGLTVAPLGRFVALVPDASSGASSAASSPELAALAARIVAQFEQFRAPLGEDDIARRRTAGLTPQQDALLLRWGYPHVMEDFRFHMTLSGSLTPQDAATLAGRLRPHFEPVLPRPFPIDAITISREGADGFFRTAHRIALSG